MERPTARVLRIGDWQADPESGQISRNGETVRVEARTMKLLLYLADHAGQVVSIDELLTEVWAGVNVAPDSVYQAITSLRRLLGDDPKQPTYIATLPRLGYRMIAPVSPYAAEITVSPDVQPTPDRRFEISLTAVIAAALIIASASAFLIHERLVNHNRLAESSAAQLPKSVAVLPFLDLTQGMKEGEFADGMTEELIDKISKIPGLRVPSPTSSFYFKDKQVPLAEIAKTLGVTYLLDGSVRKSGDRLRVAARLVQADNGYVIWTETYDRPFHDIIMVQDDIAGEVTKALRTSIENKAGH
jgi:transcriptional activator of cad operon